MSERRRLERLSWPMLVVIGKGILGDLMISNDWYVGIVMIKLNCIRTSENLYYFLELSNPSTCTFL